MTAPKIASAVLAVTLATGLCAGALAQNATPLPQDVDPKSLNRLPLLQPQDMDEATLKAYREIAGNSPERPLPNFLALALHNPSYLQALRALNRSVVREGTTGARAYEAAVLTATREAQFSESEWTSHEVSALRAGLAQSTIDTIRDGTDLKGVPEEDAIVIRFGRELFRTKRVSAETFAAVESRFGPRGTVELVGIMGDYAMVGLLLAAFDQQLPADRRLPPLAVH